ncbi:MAG: hypothetical protein AB7R90_01395 [Reyranellaceae bacterium]
MINSRMPMPISANSARPISVVSRPCQELKSMLRSAASASWFDHGVRHRTGRHRGVGREKWRTDGDKTEHRCVIISFIYNLERLSHSY